jgi:putative Holliday junction resolvase
MTILALDIGKKRVGVAISHGIVAEPIKVLDYKNYFSSLEKLIKEQSVDLVVIGLPFSASGGETNQSFFNRSEGEKIAKKFAVNVEYVDESYSSVAVDTNKKIIDDEAAKIILEQYLNEKKLL